MKTIQPKEYDFARKVRAKERWNKLAKPLNGMGMFEEMVSKIEGAQENGIEKRCVAVFCADNGVVAQGVTQTGSEVTAVVAGNMTRGDATVCKMAKVAKADVFVYDIGMLTPVAGTRDICIRRGTEDFSVRPAMTREECERAIDAGRQVAKELHAQGYTLIATGEMGIGNTTTSSAVAAALLGSDAESMTGRGAGLSDSGLSKKKRVIAQAIERYKLKDADPIDVLSKVGGLDIAGMCGVFIGAAETGAVAVIDGVISATAALCAVRICPQCREYMLASHCSGEPAARRILDAIGLRAPIVADMALGEGTGAVALFPLLDMAYAVYREMLTFGDTDIEEYKPQC